MRVKGSVTVLHLRFLSHRLQSYKQLWPFMHGLQITTSPGFPLASPLTTPKALLADCVLALHHLTLEQGTAGPWLLLFFVFTPSLVNVFLDSQAASQPVKHLTF